MPQGASVAGWVTSPYVLCSTPDDSYLLREMPLQPERIAMTRYSKGLLASVIFSFVATAGPASAADIKLAPHRATYELSLLQSKGKSVANATGGIGIEFSGNACDGYATTFRQVTRIGNSEGQTQVSDLRVTSFEAADARSFVFKGERLTDGTRTQQTDGKAERAADGGLSIDIRQPKPMRADVDSSAIFPTDHMLRLINAARNQQRLLAIPVYDGSDSGEKIYDTTAIIGPQVPVDGRAVEGPSASAGLQSVPRWPVSISYFEPGSGERTPVYVLSFDMFENGISGSLRLDFGEFSLKGEMKRLDLLTPAECKK
jgi:EipB-like